MFFDAGQALNLTGCPTNKLLELSKKIWLLNGGDGPFNHFLDSYPAVRVKLSFVHDF
jgi:hypothetical protein